MKAVLNKKSLMVVCEKNVVKALFEIQDNVCSSVQNFFVNCDIIYCFQRWYFLHTTVILYYNYLLINSLKYNFRGLKIKITIKTLAKKT